MIEVRQADSKRLFLRGPAPGTRLFLLLVISIALMFSDYRYGHLDSIRQSLSVVVYPVRVAVDAPFSALESLDDSFAGRRALREENKQLQRRNLLANVKLLQYDALEAENARLRALMESTSKVADRVLISEILHVDLHPNRHRVALDKGARNGAFQGQALLNASGIVGQITQVGPLSSEAILISDPDHAVPVEILRNGLRTIAVGTGDISVVSLPFLPNNADIRLGDRLVTSGMGGAFPRGYPVGMVSSITFDPHQPFAQIDAVPAAALNRDREVLLVWSEDQDPRIDKQRAARVYGAGASPVGGRPR
ncbi:MAG: rod shape-determining protein MreC [Gammaproteobacteria bacterium]